MTLDGDEDDDTDLSEFCQIEGRKYVAGVFAKRLHEKDSSLGQFENDLFEPKSSYRWVPAVRCAVLVDYPPYIVNNLEAPHILRGTEGRWPTMGEKPFSRLKHT